MNAWELYTSKEIKPRGWLRRQLEIQAAGLSGNLDKIWRDVRDSSWIGGDAEGWERVPYWLDGFVPLAYLLEDQDMIARAKKYIDAILAQQKPDGWICPCADDARPGYDSWAVILISKTLTVYYECSGDERIPDVIRRTLRNYYDLLKSGTIRLFDWGKSRWFEAFVAIGFLWRRQQEDWLVDLARILKEQGADWGSFTERWKHPLNKWTHETHIVNLAMMLKAEAVSVPILGGEYTDEAERLRTVLDTYNGTPVGLFTGDECLSGRSPIQGTELCAVAEQMYSYELLYAATGDAKWAERLEVLAFNALPATISDDMWAHQYDQQSNQIACVKFPGKSLFGTNNSEAHLFGLEPNFGCCTANFNQAWPKLTLSAFMHRSGEIVSAMPVPSELTTPDVSIRLDTEYPFRNSFRYEIDAKSPFTLTLRVPSFAKNAVIDGNPAACGDVSLPIGVGRRIVEMHFDTVPCFEERPYGLHTARCGSLVFSLPISYEARMLEYEKNGVERRFPYCDWEYLPTSAWNYAYAGGLTAEYRGIGNVPFASDNPPVVLKTQVRPIDWGFEPGYNTVCAKVPVSREPIGEAEEIALYPYGCAKLRMPELPKI